VAGAANAAAGAGTPVRERANPLEAAPTWRNSRRFMTLLPVTLVGGERTSVKPLPTIAPRSALVNLPDRDGNPANLCAVCRVHLPDLAKILDFGLARRDFARAAARSSTQAQGRNPPSDCCPCPSPSGASRSHRPAGAPHLGRHSLGHPQGPGEPT